MEKNVLTLRQFIGYLWKETYLFTGEGNCFVFIYEQPRQSGTGSALLNCLVCSVWRTSCFAEQDLNPISRKLIDRGKFKELFSEAFEFHIRQKSNARGSLSWFFLITHFHKLKPYDSQDFKHCAMLTFTFLIRTKGNGGDRWPMVRLTHYQLWRWDSRGKLPTIVRSWANSEGQAGTKHFSFSEGWGAAAGQVSVSTFWHFPSASPNKTADNFHQFVPVSGGLVYGLTSNGKLEASSSYISYVAFLQRKQQEEAY